MDEKTLLENIDTAVDMATWDSVPPAVKRILCHLAADAGELLEQVKGKRSQIERYRKLLRMWRPKPAPGVTKYVMTQDQFDDLAAECRHCGGLGAITDDRGQSFPCHVCMGHGSVRKTPDVPLPSKEDCDAMFREIRRPVKTHKKDD